jgi:hypothetical protein
MKDIDFLLITVLAEEYAALFEKLPDAFTHCIPRLSQATATGQPYDSKQRFR